MPVGERAALAEQAPSGDAVARHELPLELYGPVRRHIDWHVSERATARLVPIVDDGEVDDGEVDDGEVDDGEVDDGEVALILAGRF